MLYTISQNVTAVEKVTTYMDLTAQNPSFPMNKTVPNNYHAIDVAFAAALLPKQKVQQESLGNVDLFLYPIMPAIQYLDSWYADTPKPGGWYESGGDYYASSYGVFSGNPADVPVKQSNSATFRMNSAYWRLDCTKPAKKTWDDIKAMGLTLTQSKTGTLFMDIRPPRTLSNPEANNTADYKYTSAGNGNLTWVSMLNITDVNDTNYNSLDQYNTTVAYSTCNLNQTFVEAELKCTPTECTVQQQRLIPNPGTPAIGDSMSNLINAASGATEFGNPTMVELYVDNPLTVLLATQPKWPNPLAQSEGTAYFEQRLTQLFNTYWQLGFAAGCQTGFCSSNDRNLSVETMASFIAPPQEIYELSIPWLVTLLVSSIVLFLAGLASAWFEKHTIGPDILGFASSIVRQSKYISVPKGTSGESGAERARRMKDHKVMMQDVRPSGEVGKIALGTALETSVPLKPGKLYR